MLTIEQAEFSPLLMDRLNQAQAAVLGSMLIDSGVVGSCLQRVTLDDFPSGTYQPVFRAIKALFDSGAPVDPITINAKLGGNYSRILADLMDATPTAARWDVYSDLLRETSRIYRRQKLALLLAGENDPAASDALVEQINAASCDKPGVRITTLPECYQEFLARHEQGKQPAYFTWGIPPLDERIYIEPGDLVVLGGYPSAGKTALALQMAYHVAGEKRVGYFYLENNDRKLFDRLVAAKSMVPFGKIKRYDLEEDDFAAIAGIQMELIRPSLHFVDAAGMTVGDVRAVALSLHLDLVVVDYLQKLRASSVRRGAGEYERVSEVSSDLQTLGRQTGMTVLALSQLSRPEKRNGKTPAPGMHSFRQSGQIEQDADVALLLYKDDETKAVRTLKIGKNKEGVSSVAMRMHFDGDTQTFRRVSELQEPAEKKREKPKQVSFWDGWTEVPDDGEDPFPKGDGA